MIDTASPVYPIVPSFKTDELNLDDTEKYISFLESENVKTIMTTAGTSQFNLLSHNEIRKLNLTVGNHTKFTGLKILGLPMLSQKHLIEEINFYNQQTLKNVSLLLLFPERFYTNSQVLNYFKTAADYSDYPIMIHGNKLRKGYGGEFEYNNDILKELSSYPNIIGIKEESSNYDLGCNAIQDLPDNFYTIVAGGSMKRYWQLSLVSATTFLSGVGSLFPIIEESFHKAYKDNNLIEAQRLIKEYETPLFKVFMKIGWHASLREGLKILGYVKENRLPFYQINNTEKHEIKLIISELLNKINYDKNLYNRTV